ncbi:DUF185-domain-containing protein [Auriscalpium vulgare]|uniref:DUF185-domain-containing protein n=1 Tax=Auriscalpium vulgare TaxID=40419 RepID=A0ACB8RKW2_9AGAM|nr:DUF185-domain-containing protein [Auriscalpium vulgare]
MLALRGGASRVPARLAHRVQRVRTFAVSSTQSVGPVTPIEKILLDTIKANGPVSYATYMQHCLSHPTEGYYMNPKNAVFGARGDFITSPEISQVFGELVAIWMVSQFINVPQPQEIRLVELGPGRGTLMDDVLRTLSQLPYTRASLKHIHLVETSSSLRKIQEQKLQPWVDKHDLQLHWHDSIDDVPSSGESYTMLVAHEFFDALPIHLLQKTEQGWNEVLISSAPDLTAKTILRADGSPSLPSSAPRPPSLDVDTTLPSQSLSQPRLRPVLSQTPSPVSTLLGSSSPRFKNLPLGARLEVSAAAFQIARKVGEMIGGNEDGRRRGSALIIDYGADKMSGHSFRAFKDHKIVDPFYLPGQCDLTANVDFAYLIEAMAGTATTHGPITQHRFLTRMGLSTRVDALVRAASSAERGNALKEAGERLVSTTGMGKEYKVLGVTGYGREGSLPEGVDDVIWPFVKDVEGQGDRITSS